MYLSRNTFQWLIFAAQGARGRWQPLSSRGLRPRSQWVSTDPIPRRGKLQPKLQNTKVNRSAIRIGRYAWSLLEGSPNVIPSPRGQLRP